MTLFETLQRDQRLQDTTSLVYLLLKRLAISEVIAATKFKKTSTVDPDHAAVFEKIAQKCLLLKADTVQTDAILTIFRQIITLAGLIQAAWHEQSKDMKASVVKDNTLALASAITSKPITETDLLSNIRECSAILTDQIITSLINLEEIADIDLIPSLLSSCFPLIDSDSLKNAMATITLKMNTLKKDEEYQVIDQKEQEEQEETPNASSPFSCCIS